MADTRYDDLKLSARRDDTQGMYLVGVEIGDAFIPISQIKTGHVDELVERAQQQKQQEQSQSSE